MKKPQAKRRLPRDDSIPADFPPCFHCGAQEPVRTVERTQQLSCDGISATIEVPHVYCGKCQTSVWFAGVDDEFLLFAQVLARAGTATGASFQRMREALDYSAAALARLFDVRPETVARWERQEGQMERAPWLAMCALIEDRLAYRTTLEDHLFAARSPVIPKTTLSLAVPIDVRRRPLSRKVPR